MASLDPFPFIYPGSVSVVDGMPVRSMFTHGDGKPLEWAPRPEFEQDRAEYNFQPVGG